MLFTAHNELAGRILRLGPAPADLQESFVLMKFASRKMPSAALRETMPENTVCEF